MFFFFNFTYFITVFIDNICHGKAELIKYLCDEQKSYDPLIIFSSAYLESTVGFENLKSSNISYIFCFI